MARHPRVRSISRVVMVAALLASTAVADAWMARVGPGYFVFQGVFAAAPDGAVFLDAGWKPRPFERAIAIEKRGVDGTARWRRQLLGSGRGEHADEILDMAVAPDGDVVAVGRWQNPGAKLLALRLRGRDGRRRWRHEIASPAVSAGNQRANAVAIAPSGDVLVAGVLDDVEGPVPRDETFVVLALDGQRGSERWRYELQELPPPTRNEASAVAVDATGDVFAGGWITVERLPTYGARVSYVVVRLDGATGAERWRTTLDPIFGGVAFALTPEGDVAVGGDAVGGGVHNDMQVALVDGDTGALRWSRRIVTGNPTWARALAVIGLPGGDVVAAGMLRDSAGLAQYTMLRLGAEDGAERWRQQLPSDNGEGGGGVARALALTPDGHIVVGGTTSRFGSCADMTVAELAPADGAVQWVRHVDGTAQATSCVVPDCERPPCGDPRAGIDNDSLWGLAVLPSGQIVIGGEVCDGRRGRTRGLVGTLSPE